MRNQASNSTPAPLSQTGGRRRKHKGKRTCPEPNQPKMVRTPGSEKTSVPRYQYKAAQALSGLVRCAVNKGVPRDDMMNYAAHAAGYKYDVFSNQQQQKLQQTKQATKQQTYALQPPQMRPPSVKTGQPTLPQTTNRTRRP